MHRRGHSRMRRVGPPEKICMTRSWVPRHSTELEITDRTERYDQRVPQRPMPLFRPLPYGALPFVLQCCGSTCKVKALLPASGRETPTVWS